MTEPQFTASSPTMYTSDGVFPEEPSGNRTSNTTGVSYAIDGNSFVVKETEKTPDYSQLSPVSGMGNPVETQNDSLSNHSVKPNLFSRIHWPVSGTELGLHATIVGLCTGLGTVAGFLAGGFGAPVGGAIGFVVGNALGLAVGNVINLVTQKKAKTLSPMHRLAREAVSTHIYSEQLREKMPGNRAARVNCRKALVDLTKDWIQCRQAEGKVVPGESEIKHQMEKWACKIAEFLQDPESELPSNWYKPGELKKTATASKFDALADQAIQQHIHSAGFIENAHRPQAAFLNCRKALVDLTQEWIEDEQVAGRKQPTQDQINAQMEKWASTLGDALQDDQSGLPLHWNRLDQFKELSPLAIARLKKTATAPPNELRQYVGRRVAKGAVEMSVVWDDDERGVDSHNFRTLDLITNLLSEEIEKWAQALVDGGSEPPTSDQKKERLDLCWEHMNQAKTPVFNYRSPQESEWERLAGLPTITAKDVQQLKDRMKLDNDDNPDVVTAYDPVPPVTPRQSRIERSRTDSTTVNSPRSTSWTSAGSVLSSPRFTDKDKDDDDRNYLTSGNE